MFIENDAQSGSTTRARVVCFVRHHAFYKHMMPAASISISALGIYLEFGIWDLGFKIGGFLPKNTRIYKLGT